MLWDEIKQRKILGHKFRRQYSIGAYVIDFYCTGLKLSIEIDGVTHGTTEEIEYDKLRQEELENIDIVFLRFRNQEVFENIQGVVEKIAEKAAVLSGTKD